MNTPHPRKRSTCKRKYSRHVVLGKRLLPFSVCHATMFRMQGIQDVSTPNNLARAVSACSQSFDQIYRRQSSGGSKRSREEQFVKMFMTLGDDEVFAAQAELFRQYLEEYSKLIGRSPITEDLPDIGPVSTESPLFTLLMSAGHTAAAIVDMPLHQAVKAFTTINNAARELQSINNNKTRNINS